MTSPELNLVFLVLSHKDLYVSQTKCFMAIPVLSCIFQSDSGTLLGLDIYLFTL